MTRIPEETLELLADTVHRHLGLHFPRERWGDLARGVEATCRDLGITGVESCTRELLTPPLTKELVETLGRHLTIGETYFFRELPAFCALEERLLPPLLERRRHEGKCLRLWSAACASGEEPYSLAILVRTLLPDPQEWNITILGTDINTDSLRRAEEGIYREWSFRGVKKSVLQGWFTPTPDGRYQVREDIRAMVTFAYHNLVDDPYPSLFNQTNAMDVIFCRNVLMYFSDSTRQQVLSHLERSLVEGGILALGSAESSLRPPAGLAPLHSENAALYRKSPRWGSAPAPPPPPVAPPARKPAPPRRQEHRQEQPPGIREVFARGDYETVCRRAAALVKGDQQIMETALIAARSCANLGKLQEALAWVDQAIALERLNPEAHYLRAMILDERREWAAARDALRTTLYLDPSFVPAYVAMGNILRREGDRNQAERSFRNALILLEPLEDDAAVHPSEEIRVGRMREAIFAAMGGADER